MAKNRFSKYLLYAIGEVILVVIGILIALQINTWSKEKQNKTLERTALVNLKEDLIIQKEIAQIQIDNEAMMMIRADSAMLYLEGKIDVPTFHDVMQRLVTRRTFISNRATFNNMTSSGGSVLIKDSELQNHVVRYFQRLDYVEKVINNNNIFLIDNMFGHFFYNNDIGLGMDPNGILDTSFAPSPEMRLTIHSQLTERHKVSEIIHGISGDLMAETDSLISHIEQALQE